MIFRNGIFSSESVTKGHPDKVADQISDAILDECLKQDPNSRVAIETMVSENLVIVAGEVTTEAKVLYDFEVRNVVKEIGYTHDGIGFKDSDLECIVKIKPQSPDISQGVTEGTGLFRAQGAGDQGMMFGFACKDTPELMPLPISLAHGLTRKLAEVRKTGEIPYLLPDGKAQVSVSYIQGRPVVEAVVVSSHHLEDVDLEEIREDIRIAVINPVCGYLMTDATRVFVNPTGRFVEGGPKADVGLTGRKIIVDTYGGMGRHGGGAFSGKDPSKVDRSGAYAARQVAKSVVAIDLAEICEVQIAYAIGYSKPVGIAVESFGTGDNGRIERYVTENFDLTPRGIVNRLDLRKPIFRATAVNGHFGNELFPWERV